jgi:hypothetical protein
LCRPEFVFETIEAGVGRYTLGEATIAGDRRPSCVREFVFDRWIATSDTLVAIACLTEDPVVNEALA